MQEREILINGKCKEGFMRALKRENPNVNGSCLSFQKPITFLGRFNYIKLAWAVVVCNHKLLYEMISSRDSFYIYVK